MFHLDITLFSGGFVGVDVFFVISGFLITRLIVDEINKTGAVSFANFYLRRVRRLFPALLFILVLTLLAATIIFSPADLQNLGGSVFHAILSISNIYFWQEAGYFDDAIKLNPLLHTWSLSVEEQFYLVWPAPVLFVASKWGMRAVINVLIIIIVSSLLLNLVFDQSFILYFWPSTSSQNLEDIRAAMFYLGPFRNFELGLGALLVFFIHHRLKNKLLNEGLFIIGITMILISIFTYTDKIIYPSYNALLPCLGTVLIIYAGNPVVTGRLLNNRLAVGVGLVSYSLYLVHWPIISFYKYLNLKPLSASDQFMLAGASVWLAVFMYKFIEQPFRKPLKSISLAMPNVKFGTVIGASSIAVILCAGNMWGNDGWLWRIDERRSAILSKIKSPGKFHVNYYGGRNCKPHLLCSVNADKEPNIYFIGDSHSHAYAYGLAKKFSDYKCTHLDNRCEYSTFDYCYAGQYQESNFVERKATDFKFLKKTSDKIIIAQNWGNRPKHFNTKTKELITFATIENYVEFLAREIDEVIKTLGKDRVLVMGQVHRFGRRTSPLSCMGLPIKVRNCETSRGGFVIKFNRLFAVEMKVREIQFLSPTDVMCKKGACINMNSSGMPLFSDWRHLSTWGSQYLVKRFEKPLAKFFQSKR